MTKDVKKEVVKIRIAVISDIHGNIVALDAILEDLKKDKIDKVVSLGDFCNELPNGNEVAERLREINAYSILGNKEEYFLQYDVPRRNNTVGKLGGYQKPRPPDVRRGS